MKPDELQILVKEAELSKEKTETNFTPLHGPFDSPAAYTAKQMLRGIIWSQDWRPARIADIDAYAGIVKLKPMNHKSLN